MLANIIANFIIGAVVVAVLISRERWKYKAKEYKIRLEHQETKLTWYTNSYQKLKEEMYKIKPKHDALVEDMRTLCREHSNPSKVENIINRWVKTFNNPNP